MAISQQGRPWVRDTAGSDRRVNGVTPDRTGDDPTFHLEGARAVDSHAALSPLCVALA